MEGGDSSSEGLLAFAIDSEENVARSCTHVPRRFHNRGRTILSSSCTSSLPVEKRERMDLFSKVSHPSERHCVPAFSMGRRGGTSREREKSERKEEGGDKGKS